MASGVAHRRHLRPQAGSATEFGSAVAGTTPPAGDLDEAVDVLDKGARLDGSRLYSSPGTLARVAMFADPTDEAANMDLINAMVFQERLQQGGGLPPVSASLRPEGSPATCYLGLHPGHRLLPHIQHGQVRGE